MRHFVTLLAAALPLAACGGQDSANEAVDANQLPASENILSNDLSNAAPPDANSSSEATGPTFSPSPQSQDQALPKAIVREELRPRPARKTPEPEPEPDPHAGHDMNNMSHD